AGVELARHSREGIGLKRREAAEREKWHVGDMLRGELVDQSIVVAMSEIVLVLYTHDIGDVASFVDLCGRHIAQTQMADEALPLKAGERRELLRDRGFARRMDC